MSLSALTYPLCNCYGILLQIQKTDGKYCFIIAFAAIALQNTRDGCSYNLCCRQTAESDGYQVIPAFCGHGIGSYFHGPPDIIHVGMQPHFSDYCCC